MIKLIASILLLATVMVSSEARKVKVPPPAKGTPTDTRSTEATRENIIIVDSVSNGDTKLTDIQISGYDKAVNSTKETIFVTNATNLMTKNIELEISYFSTDGKQLHSRIVTLPCNIPGKSTRRLDFNSWDRQQSFYYEHSRVPKRRVAKPYRVKIKPIRATFNRQ